MTELPLKGAASAETRSLAHQEWMEAARRAGLELTGFDPDAPLEQRITWAIGAGLLIATIYTRFSTKRQNSTADQVRACVLYAAAHGMYVPPELICADEGVKGRKIRRDGLDRLKAILKAGTATVLLVFKFSRLFRHAYMGFQLVQQEVVEEGRRAVSVSQGIDTADEKSWKAQLQLHGLLDDLLSDAIADHVREGLIGIFKNGWTTGALPIGYRPVEVPGAAPTKPFPAVDRSSRHIRPSRAHTHRRPRHPRPVATARPARPADGRSVPDPYGGGGVVALRQPGAVYLAAAHGRPTAVLARR
jgi:DNA invertase Pin-like site-specific DNA recombinase